MRCVNDALRCVFRCEEFAEWETIDLLISLDINMPGCVNGAEVLAQVKANHTTRKDVITLSSTVSLREITRCHELGCSGCITQPINPARLIETIKRLERFLKNIRPLAADREALRGPAS